MKVSPAYLLTEPRNLTTTTYTNNAALTVTPLIGSNGSDTSFFVIRHTDYSSESSEQYKLKVPTSAGQLTIPQLGDSNLSLNGRDSKIHVVDYDVAGTNIIYSTAEIFTWKQFVDHKVLVLYGGANEHHELEVAVDGKMSVLEGSESKIASKKNGKSAIIGWDVSPTRQIVQVGDLKIFLLGKSLSKLCEFLIHS
jgi:beta-galactosidase